jgi:Sulfotransferase domain
MLKTAVRCSPVGEATGLAYRVLRSPQYALAERAFGDAFLLVSMRKSGTHYTMSLLANYLSFHFLGGEDRVDFRAMEQDVWAWCEPKSRAARQRRNNESLDRLRASTPYHCWLWRHANGLIRLNNAKTIIGTYRNPLDTFVSCYHFWYINRRVSAVPSIDDAIEIEIPSIAGEYADVRVAARRRNGMRVAYERLVRDPLGTLDEVLEFARIERDADDELRAVEASAAEHIASDEARYCPDGGNLVGTDMTVGFVRSGKVGEWKGFLGNAQLRRIEELLKEYRITLDEFVLE